MAFFCLLVVIVPRTLLTHLAKNVFLVRSQELEPIIIIKKLGAFCRAQRRKNCRCYHIQQNNTFYVVVVCQKITAAWTARKAIILAAALVRRIKHY